MKWIIFSLSLSLSLLFHIPAALPRSVEEGINFAQVIPTHPLPTYTTQKAPPIHMKKRINGPSHPA